MLWNLAYGLQFGHFYSPDSLFIYLIIIYTFKEKWGYAIAKKQDWFLQVSMIIA